MTHTLLSLAIIRKLLLEGQAKMDNSETLRRGYRIAEAARYMGVSPWFIELKIRSGELPAFVTTPCFERIWTISSIHDVASVESDRRVGPQPPASKGGNIRKGEL